MANEKQPKQDDKSQKPLRIDNIPDTASGEDENVKGGMISRGGGGVPTDEFSDELGGGD